MPKTTTVNVRFPAKLLRGIDKLAESWGTDRSGILKIAAARIVEAESFRVAAMKAAAKIEAEQRR